LWAALTLLIRAFGLGVSMCGPLFIGAILLVFTLGSAVRVAPALPVRTLGLLLTPWLVLVLTWTVSAQRLTLLPELLRAFVQAAARDLGAIP
jgi:hypothetical protein